MTTVGDIFKARAESFGETMTGGSSVVSYRIPEYQRAYDWSKDNVRRLLSDCLNGLKGAADPSNQHPYTFLGTIILAPDESKEQTFDGQSLSVVDGQQRMTTLLLLSCALFESLRFHKSDINDISDDGTKRWLEDEHLEQSQRLFRCTTGRILAMSLTDPFPRMVRTEDVRGHSFKDTQYKSVIADFFMQFSEFCLSQKNDFSPTFDGSEQESHLIDVYNYISSLLEKHVYNAQEPDEEEEFPLVVFNRTEFERRGCRSLFSKLRDQGSESDHIASTIANEPDSEGIVRLLLFSSYVIQSVVLTVVQAPTEDIAFDIFDALNTTGEPLTALETLKPHIVRFENVRVGTYIGSPSESAWRAIEENIIEPHSTPQRRRTETQELVTGFALYFAGQKLGADLRVQRNTLRSYFIRASGLGDEIASGFVYSLANFAHYKTHYWPREGIDALVGPVSEQDDYDLLRLCLRFIRDTGTSTTIPILARYQIESGEMDCERNYLRAVKAVVAFLVLRRAMTGGTSRIDSDFRNVMSGTQSSDDNGLCLGESLLNPILSINELKERFRLMLAGHPFNVDGKDAWLKRACEVPLANQASRIVCRFLILAAAHNARADENTPGLSLKKGIIPTPELSFMNHSSWIGAKYATLEHIAPDSPASVGWDSAIYEHSDTRHTIGNLVLLPEKENQSIGNSPWARKRLFYKALMAKTEPERIESIKMAEEQGLEFGNKTLLLINQQDRLHMLDPIGLVENWTVDMIRRRTENILSLAWDELSPWLYD